MPTRADPARARCERALHGGTTHRRASTCTITRAAYRRSETHRRHRAVCMSRGRGSSGRVDWQRRLIPLISSAIAGQWTLTTPTCAEKLQQLWLTLSISDMQARREHQANPPHTHSTHGSIQRPLSAAIAQACDSAAPSKTWLTGRTRSEDTPILRCSTRTLKQLFRRHQVTIIDQVVRLSGNQALLSAVQATTKWRSHSTKVRVE